MPWVSSRPSVRSSSDAHTAELLGFVTVFLFRRYGLGTGRIKNDWRLVLFVRIEKLVLQIVFVHEVAR